MEIIDCLARGALAEMIEDRLARGAFVVMVERLAGACIWAIDDGAAGADAFKAIEATCADAIAGAYEAFATWA